MASQASTREAFEVTLIGLGEGIQKLAMQSGSKVGDLIRAADTSSRDWIESSCLRDDPQLEGIPSEPFESLSNLLCQSRSRSTKATDKFR